MQTIVQTIWTIHKLQTRLCGCFTGVSLDFLLHKDFCFDSKNKESFLKEKKLAILTPGDNKCIFWSIVLNGECGQGVARGLWGRGEDSRSSAGPLLSEIWHPGDNSPSLPGLGITVCTGSLSSGPASLASPVTSVGLGFSIFRMIALRFFSRFHTWTVWSTAGKLDLFFQN